jgi:hypothetical protein
MKRKNPLVQNNKISNISTAGVEMMLSSQEGSALLARHYARDTIEGSE